MASPSHHSVLKEELPDQPVIIDMPKDLEPDLNNTCWIFKVPEKLRKVNEAADAPHLVSIGPLHHGNPKLNAMEHQKFKYEQQFWNRDSWKHIEEGKRIEFMDNLLPRIQSSYAVTFEFDPAVANNRLDFIRMILRDACFIFELFLRNDENRSGDYILRTPWLKAGIKLDLIMLENQLPYFVFKELFDLIYPKDENGTESKNNHYLSGLTGESKGSDFFKNISCEFFLDYYYYRFGKPLAEITYMQMTQSTHKIRFADLVKELKDESLCFRGDQFPEKDDAIFCLCTATQLSRAGVKFVRCKENRVIADINKKTEPYPMFKGVYRNYLKLEIPELKVQGNTECIMRNVMALEQFVYPDEPFICNYVFLLDQLISIAEDVEFMIDKKIVHNWLGSNEAVATLMRVYFKDIFTISSMIIGTVSFSKEKKNIDNLKYMGIKEACADEDQRIIIDIPEDLEPDLNSSCWIHRVPRKIGSYRKKPILPS
nr:UPF0481 protein At3g47200-like [Ziziphus jujuba var. spinosa]